MRWPWVRKSRVEAFIDEWEAEYGLGSPLPAHWGLTDKFAELRELIS